MTRIFYKYAKFLLENDEGATFFDVRARIFNDIFFLNNAKAQVFLSHVLFLRRKKIKDFQQLKRYQFIFI